MSAVAAGRLTKMATVCHKLAKLQQPVGQIQSKFKLTHVFLTEHTLIQARIEIEQIFDWN